MVTYQDVLAAQRRIAVHVHRTPLLTCRTFDRACSAEIHFKCENFQRAGAFKIRGAMNAVFSLTDEEAEKGVATHSSGNHAAALALAAGTRGIPAQVVMPSDAPRVKVRAVEGYGARIVFCEPTLTAREETLDRVLRDTGAVPIHPYDDERIIAGQGTAALELCEDTPALDAVLAPVGGGGLLSGTALTLRGFSPDTAVFGTEPQAADDAYRSLQAGERIPVEHPDTIADGLRTSLGLLTFPIIRENVTAIVTVSEKEIIDSMRSVWERMKILIEPSAAVPVAALLHHRSRFPGTRFGVILSGGNLDLDGLPWQTGTGRGEPFAKDPV